MKYRVIWWPEAEQDLAAVWLAATDRHAVTLASAELESRLGTTPLRTGYQRESSVRRYAVVPPLGIEFEVVEDDKKVIVQAVFAVS